MPPKRANKPRGGLKSRSARLLEIEEAPLDLARFVGPELFGFLAALSLGLAGARARILSQGWSRAREGDQKHN